MAHSVLQVANKIIEIGGQQGMQFTPMQLIKLTYIAHGWMLGLFDRSLFDESVEAWKFGPVIPKLYHQVKAYRNSNITAPIVDVPETTFNNEELKVLDYVVKAYKEFDGVDLSRITHAEGTPWDQTYPHNVTTWHNYQIPNTLIQNHYKKLFKEKVKNNA
ncbi:Panacea domain-containing protein [Acinetobacter bereziniae]|uniref:Panacea domain-containing protein n=1 Tax=Acinetobacter bereziniae TaxID=106648 RepID=UPI00295551C5|nr:type II toxin-antitoxin system antitoxin SocA domain-containing protein [Acinetobacter bereziniae]MDV8155179.1 DUF4065 domain-containing protein [Acinetobacter bereziniae]